MGAREKKPDPSPLSAQVFPAGTTTATDYARWLFAVADVAVTEQECLAVAKTLTRLAPAPAITTPRAQKVQK